MVSYISLSLLKLYSIARPLHYRKSGAQAWCKRLIACSWLTFVLFLPTTAVVGAVLERVAGRDTWSAYVKTIRTLVYSFPATSYIATMACFLVTCESEIRNDLQ